MNTAQNRRSWKWAHAARREQAAARRERFADWVQARGGAEWLRQVKAHGATVGMIARMAGTSVKVAKDVAGEMGVWLPDRPTADKQRYPVPRELQALLIRTHEAHPDVPLEALVSAALEALRVKDPQEDEEATPTNA